VPASGDYYRNPGPAERSFAITPHDTNELPYITRGIYVGATGDIAVGLVGDQAGTTVVLKAVPTGTVLPVCAKLVKSTGTTATLLIGLI
jgi:hypothetical protein